MRLRSLELIAYGPFRGLALDFSAPGLHVVLGRNEAGKSTTLRAITGLLYGIDAKTPDGHLHKLPDLRIGGVLESGSGERVRVIRRKGNSNTLLDDRDQPIDEGVMKRLLAGVSKESFVHAFGLTHEALGAGAQALLEGRGDLGESLFDASLGGGGEVQRLVAELKAEAERIYKPRGATLPLNDALKVFAEAQRSVREKESKPEAFLEQERGLNEAIAEREARLEQRGELLARRTRLERARKRLPLERRQRRALERAAQLGLSAEHVERIHALRERFAGYKHALEQRGALLAERDRLGTLVAEAMRRAGVKEGAETDVLRLDARTESRINTLLRERTKLRGTIDAATHEIAKQERELARLRAASVQGAAARPSDAIELASALEQARSLGDIEARLASKRSQIERRRGELHTLATSDRLFCGTLEAFVDLRVPVATSIERLETRERDCARAVAAVEERIAHLEREAASLERQIATHSGDFAPPDASALRAARDARDVAWRALQDATESTRRSLELDLERLLREADAVADRMIREADRVTVLARLRSEAETNANQRAKLEAERTRAAAAHAALDGELGALFSEAGIEPPHPAAFSEMSAWLARHAKVRDAFAGIRDAELELADDEQKHARARTALVRALAVAGPGLAAPEGKGLAELIALGAQRVDAFEAARRLGEESGRALVKITGELEDRIAAKVAEEAALADVSAKLGELIVPLGIPLDAADDEVSRSIEALRDLFALVDKRAELELRARGYEVTILELERDLARAVDELAPDLRGTELREAGPMLFQRASDAHAAALEIASVTSELEADGEVTLDDEERALLNDGDATQRALDHLVEQLDEADVQINRLAETIGSLRNGLALMRAESNAAEASATAQLHLARVRDYAERWCRVRLAAHLLSREIERYREENQAPLLASSSQLFSRLTLGSFSGIKAGFDDKDRPCLKCIRSEGGAEVDVAGLSDGSRDQLYLSLRLASLLRRADVAEPMPLVLDDVFIQLDDQRAAVALAVLAEVSRRMQVLFFTHHARLVELARSAVAPSDLSVHELVSGPYAVPTLAAAAT